MDGAKCGFQAALADAAAAGDAVRQPGSGLEHFGLVASPFRLNGDETVFFCGTKRRATLDALIYALTQDEGVVKVGGEPGSGKTTLLRRLERCLPESVRSVRLDEPGLSAEDLLRTLATGLDLPMPAGSDAERLATVRRGLDDWRQRGGRLVVLVDDAQSMPAETLALLCRLCDDEAHQHRVHVALFGTAALDACLAGCRARLPALRVTYNFVLDQLSREEVSAYLGFCLEAVGYAGPPLFSPAAVEAIWRGCDRQFARINQLAERALQCAASAHAARVERPAVEAALQGRRLAPSSRRWQNWRVRGLSGLAAAISLCLLAAVGLRSAPSLALPPLSPPVLPMSAESPSEPWLARPDGGGAGLSGMASGWREDTVATTEAWLREVPDSHFVIQMLRVGVAETARVERFLADVLDRVDPAELRVYRSRLSGQARIGVIYGDFPDRQTAQAALARLLAAMPDGGFYVRPVSRLR